MIRCSLDLQVTLCILANPKFSERNISFQELKPSLISISRSAISQIFLQLSNNSNIIEQTADISSTDRLLSPKPSKMFENHGFISSCFLAELGSFFKIMELQFILVHIFAAVFAPSLFLTFSRSIIVSSSDHSASGAVCILTNQP